MYRLISMLMLLGAVATWTGCRQTPPEPIRIGYLGTLSGTQSFLGNHGRDGALLAVEEVNRQGGLNGRPVELVIKDDHFNQGQARRAFGELQEQRVAGIIGPMASEVAAGIRDLANASRLVVLSPTTSGESFTGQDDYFLRIYPTADEGTVKIAHYAVHDRNLRSFAVVYDLANAAFSLSWLESFKRDYQAEGGALAAQIPFDSLTSSVPFQQMAQKVAASGAQGLLILANAYNTALLCQNLAKLGVQPDTYITEWSYGPNLYQYGGSAVENLMVFKTYKESLDTTREQTFADTFQARFGERPWFAATHAYDATRLLLAGLSQNQPTADLKETLLTLGEFEGVQTSFQLNRFGDVNRPHYVARIFGGEEVLVARLEDPSPGIARLD